MACNDIASAGARPIGMMITLLLPPDIEQKQIQETAHSLCQAAEELGVEIIGGHTEVTATATATAAATGTQSTDDPNHGGDLSVLLYAAAALAAGGGALALRKKK